METRITLRLNKELDSRLEKAKRQTGLSKNQLIVNACKKLMTGKEEKQ